MLKNLVFGSSGLVGNEFYKLNKDKQKYFFFSNKNSSFKKLNLDKKINLNWEDDIVNAVTLTHEGKLRLEQFK